LSEQERQLLKATRHTECGVNVVQIGEVEGPDEVEFKCLACGESVPPTEVEPADGLSARAIWEVLKVPFKSTWERVRGGRSD